MRGISCVTDDGYDGEYMSVAIVYLEKMKKTLRFFMLNIGSL